jgi:Reverse transcriptase (RNA-dependent DNA polymerase)
MEGKKVWKIMKKEGIPNDRRCIKRKWIFNTKRNGVFRASLVTCGYSSIPGIDFNERDAPDINDISFRIMLIAKLIWGLQDLTIDDETAFLQRNL